MCRQLSLDPLSPALRDRGEGSELDEWTCDLSGYGFQGFFIFFYLNRVLILSLCL